MLYLLVQRTEVLHGHNDIYAGVFELRSDAEAAIAQQPINLRWQFVIYPVMFKRLRTPEYSPP